MSLSRQLAAEFLGSLLLTGVVIGSGVMASRLTHDGAVALLANTAATAAILFVLVSAFASISGAHFNPAVTLVMTLNRQLGRNAAIAYVIVQISGCIAGALLAHAMFDLPLVQISHHARVGATQALSEGVATFALVATVLIVAKLRPQAIAASVALVIAAGYWWTASTSFANPAITIARALSDTFAGVRPEDTPEFIAAQFGGALIAFLVCAWLLRDKERG